LLKFKGFVASVPRLLKLIVDTKTSAQRKYIQRSHFRLILRKGFFQSAMFLASALKRGSHPPENILKI
jgi:hypothetical protein